MCINSFICTMENKDLNRLKVVLAEKKKTNKWLAEQCNYSGGCKAMYRTLLGVSKVFSHCKGKGVT